MPKRILIVEDEQDNLSVIQQILEFILNHNDFEIATDGHEAIQKTYSYQPHIILMDLSIPKLNGWETTKSLRSDKSLKHIVILALTAHAMVGDREKALEAGCDDYFTKPIEIDKFVEFITPYLTTVDTTNVETSPSNDIKDQDNLEKKD